MAGINDRYYVYAYYEPGLEKPFYIGKGCGNRDIIHLTLVKYNQNTLFYRKLSKMFYNGVNPIVKRLLENLSEEVALEREIYFIKAYGRRDIGTGCLCNHTDGGDSLPNQTGFQHSDETKRKIGSASLAWDLILGPNRSPKARSKETRLKASKLFTELRGQPVECFDLNTGLTIRVYPSLKSTNADGYDSRNVHRCANGITKSHRGVGWRYAVMKGAS